jgi:5-(carboxyamino)imidazole ribonucleotide synthase
VPARAAERVASKVPLHPGLDPLRIGSDRLEEKSLFRDLGIDTAPFEPVDSDDDLRRALARIGLPAVLKTRRLGYDGKGQRVLRREEDAAGAFASLGSVPCIVEGFAAFDRELSVIGVRAASGATAVHPLFENRHEDGILRTSICPAAAEPATLALAHAAFDRIAGRLGYVGVLAVELFDVGGRILANEMAPRVHNTGHLTIEGSETSQFENHLRAVAGLPLGSTAPRGHSGMVNLVGAIPDPASLLAIGGAHLHLYGKAPRPGRKVGHVTVRADDAQARDRILGEVLHVVGAAVPAR